MTCQLERIGLSINKKCIYRYNSKNITPISNGLSTRWPSMMSYCVEGIECKTPSMSTTQKGSIPLRICTYVVMSKPLSFLHPYYSTRRNRITDVNTPSLESRSYGSEYGKWMKLPATVSYAKICTYIEIGKGHLLSRRVF